VAEATREKFLVIMPKAVNRSDCILFPAGSWRVSGGLPGAGLGGNDGCACGARDSDSGPGAGGRRVIVGVDAAQGGWTRCCCWKEERRGRWRCTQARGPGRAWRGAGVAGVRWDAGIAVFLQYVPSSLNSWSCNHWSQQQALHTHTRHGCGGTHLGPGS
jgi:hypothetical protein